MWWEACSFLSVSTLTKLEGRSWNVRKEMRKQGDEESCFMCFDSSLLSLLFSGVVLRNYKKIACDCSLKCSAEESSQKCPRQITETSHTLLQIFTWTLRGFLSPGVCSSPVALLLICSLLYIQWHCWLFLCGTQCSVEIPVANIQCLLIDLWYVLLRPADVKAFIRFLLAWITN